MIVVSRFDVPESEAAAFLPQARTALAAFAARPGFLRGRVARAADDATAWLLTTEWEGVGAYRRSLSAYDVKLAAIPLLSLSRDEPSAFEVLHAEDLGQQGISRGTTHRSGRSVDADTTSVGESSGPATSDV